MVRWNTLGPFTALSLLALMLLALALLALALLAVATSGSATATTTFCTRLCRVLGGRGRVFLLTGSSRCRSVHCWTGIHSVDNGLFFCCCYCCCVYCCCVYCCCCCVYCVHCFHHTRSSARCSLCSVNWSHHSIHYCYGCVCFVHCCRHTIGHHWFLYRHRSIQTHTIRRSWCSVNRSHTRYNAVHSTKSLEITHLGLSVCGPRDVSPYALCARDDVGFCDVCRRLVAQLDIQVLVALCRYNQLL